VETFRGNLFMVEDPLFYTRTMARLLVRQGKRQEAAEIYRHLLSEKDTNKEVRTALAALEKGLRGKRNARQRNMAGLFARWIELILRVNGLQKLDALMKASQGQRTE
jgi:hypothetical protein